MAQKSFSHSKSRSKKEQVNKITKAFKEQNFWHRVHCTIQYRPEHMGQFPPAKLRGLVRNLLFDKNNASGKSNKDFFRLTFGGGLYTTRIEQCSNEFVVHIFISFYNGTPELSSEVKHNINERIKALVPLSSTLAFEPPSFTPITDEMEIGSEILNLMCIPTRADPQSGLYKRMGASFKAFVEIIQQQEGEAFGGMLKLVREMKRR